jgi:hypothetical protein
VAGNRGCWRKEQIDEKRSRIETAERRHAGGTRALLRAARRAREIARQTNTPIVFVRDGVLVKEMVTEIEDEERVPPADVVHDGD